MQNLALDLRWPSIEGATRKGISILGHKISELRETAASPTSSCWKAVPGRAAKSNTASGDNPKKIAC
jgi:hypothetical protein